MGKVQKKLIILIIFFILVLLINGKVYAKSYSIDNMDMQVTVLENGSINVKQSITYNFNGSYNGIYITIPYNLKDSEYKEANKTNNESIYNGNSVVINEIYDSKGISYSQTSHALNGEKGIYTLDNDPQKYTLKVYSPSQDTLKTFMLDYNINNICVKYADVGELYYNFIGGEWDVTIKKLNIDIYLPNNESKEDLYAFGHGPYNGKVTILSNNRINFNVQDIKKGQYVAARVVFNTNNIRYSVKRIDENALAQIMQEEKNIYENKEAKQKFTQRLLIIAIALFIYWIILLVVFENDKKYIAANASEDELFKKYNPLIAGCIQGSREVLSRDIIAVILNLIDKKIIKMEVIPSLSIKDAYQYDLKVIDKKRNEMDEIEVFVCDWLFDNKEVIRIPLRLRQMAEEKEANEKFKELNKLAKKKLNRIGANTAKVPMQIRMLNTLILLASIILVIMDFSNNKLSIGEFTGELSVFILIFVIRYILIVPALLYIPIYILVATRHRVSKIIRRFTGQKVAATAASILLLFLVIIILTAVLATSSKFLIIDELLICISLLLVLTDNLMLKNDVTVIEDYSKLNMLKNKLQDDILFENRDLEQVILWGKYLAYSVAFGVSSKIAKKMKELHIDDDLEILLEDEKMFKHIYYGYNDFYRYASLDRKFIRSYGKFVETTASKGFSGGRGGGFSRRRRIPWRRRKRPEVGGAF